MKSHIIYLPINLLVSSDILTLPACPSDSILFATALSLPNISYLTIFVPIIPAIIVP